MALAQNDDVIQALSTHTADEALGNGIHVRCAKSSPDHASSGGSGAVERSPELAVSISKDESRAFAEGRRVANLLSCPGGRWPAGNVNANDGPRTDIDDEEGEDRPEPDVVGLQKVAGPNAMVTKECLPALVMAWPGRSHHAHVLLNRPFRDADAQLQKLTPNAFGTPKRVLDGHAPDELYQLAVDLRQLWFARSRLESPKESKSRAMPLEDRFRFHNQRDFSPLLSKAGGCQHNKAIPAAQPGALGPAVQDNQLLSQQYVFGNELRATSPKVLGQSRHRSAGAGDDTNPRPKPGQRLAQQLIRRAQHAVAVPGSTYSCKIALWEFLGDSRATAVSNPEESQDPGRKDLRIDVHRDTSFIQRYSTLMATPKLDELLAAIRDLPLDERQRLIEQAAREVADDTPKPGPVGEAATSVIGLMADEPDIVDQMCSIVYQARSEARMRTIDE